MNGENMRSQKSHLSDQDIVLAVDGELPPRRMEEVAAHLLECWSCRVRKQEMEEAIVDFVHLHHGNLNPLVPPAAGPRALLRASLAERASSPPPWLHRVAQLIPWKGAIAALLLAVMVATTFQLWRSLLGWHPSAHLVPVSFPEPSLTPGAVTTVNRQQVCTESRPQNRTVPVSLQNRVFEEYGIPSAEPRAYEVDYLITPALGGADDIRNLWPQSYSSAVWNAHVKDDLEGRLRELVCDGSLDLVAAQHDISSDWIAAYKKYFHTDKPLAAAR